MQDVRFPTDQICTLSARYEHPAALSRCVPSHAFASVLSSKRATLLLEQSPHNQEAATARRANGGPLLIEWAGATHSVCACTASTE
eukprot:773721-Amphidinium_carterae.1